MSGISYDGLDLNSGAYRARIRPNVGAPPRMLSVVEYGARPGGRLTRARDGVKHIPLDLIVKGSSASALEAAVDTLKTTLYRENRRLIASAQDNRFWLARLAGWGAKSVNPFLVEAQAEFVAEDPWQQGETPWADVRTPTLTANPGVSSSYRTTFSITPGGTVPVALEVYAVNQTGGVTPTAWIVRNITARNGQFDTGVYEGVYTAASVAAGSSLLFTPDGAAFSLSMSNIKGYWPLEDTSGNPLDFSGASLDMTSVSSAPIYASDGPIGRCITFDGVDDALRNTAAGLELTGQVTLMAWIKPAVAGTEMAAISRALGVKGYAMWKSSGDLFKFDIGNGTSVRTATGITVATAGRWYHVAGTLDGSGNVTIYVNGQMEGQTGGGAFTPGASVGNDFYAGVSTALSGSGTTYWNGGIARLTLHTTALTAAQVLACYQSGVVQGLGTRVALQGRTPLFAPGDGASATLEFRADHGSTAPTPRTLVSARPRYSG